jgi:DNA-binding MarR family transcriptional regulator
MSDAGLTLTQQPPLSSLVELTADTTAHRLWTEIANTEAFWRGFADALASLDIEQSHQHHHETTLKDEYGVTAMGGVYAAMLTRRGHPNDQLWDVLQLHEQFGAPGRSRAGWHLSLRELRDGPLAVLRAGEWTPTVSIRINNRFEDLRPEQQDDVIWLIAELAQAVDLRLVATGRWQRKLARRYREELPHISEAVIAEPTGRPPIEEVVEAADAQLDPESREVRILRLLNDESSETLSHTAIRNGMSVSASRVSQCLTKIEKLHLVESFRSQSGKSVELHEPGRQYLDELNDRIGRQERLDERFSESGNPSVDSRVTPHAHEGRPSPTAEAEGGAERSGSGGGCGSGGGAGVADDRDSGRHRLPHHHQVRSAARHRYAAAAGTATDGGITLVDQPLPEKDDRGEPHWYYDHENDRLLVGAEYDNPMKGWVCIALALANPRTFRHVLTPERFEAGKLGDMLANHTDLLRNSRCLGYLKDANATAEDYTDALLGAAEDLRELTKDWYHGNYENPKQFRATILREAHGLAGTMVHLLDLADVDLVREFRLPKFIRDSAESNREDFVTTIATGASIQSRYREFAAYRQLFEEREDKRESAIPPRVDADDPFGDLIGSFVLVGKSVTSLADPLRRRLANQEVHDDAPEFAVHVPVEVADERHYTAQTVRLMCGQKHIRPTRAATSLLAALTGTPYDAAKALHNLGSETKAPNRELRLDEVRYALGTLDTDRIVPNMSKPALSKIVHTFLVAETPLTQSELAERADVSARSIRTHTERLAAFDFVRETDAGWRFALPFHTDEERGDDILPWFVATDDSESDETFVRDVLDEVVYDLLDSERYADPEDPVARALFAGPGEVIPALREAWGWLDPWIRVVQTLLDAPDGPPPGRTTATVGVEPEQASLAAAAGGQP